MNVTDDKRHTDHTAKKHVAINGGVTCTRAILPTSSSSSNNNIIHPLLVSLSSVLMLGYMDYVTLGGPQETVAKDIKLIMNAGQDIGLNLNTATFELVCNPGCHITDPTISGLRQVPASETAGTAVVKAA